jgi:hypothetical protein
MISVRPENFTLILYYGIGTKLPGIGTKADLAGSL